MTDLFDNHITGHWGYCNAQGCGAAAAAAAVEAELAHLFGQIAGAENRAAVLAEVQALEDAATPTPAPTRDPTPAGFAPGGPATPPGCFLEYCNLHADLRHAFCGEDPEQAQFPPAPPRQRCATAAQAALCEAHWRDVGQLEYHGSSAGLDLPRLRPRRVVLRAVGGERRAELGRDRGVLPAGHDRARARHSHRQLPRWGWRWWR